MACCTMLRKTDRTESSSERISGKCELGITLDSYSSCSPWLSRIFCSAKEVCTATRILGSARQMLTRGLTANTNNVPLLPREKKTLQIDDVLWSCRRAIMPKTRARSKAILSRRRRGSKNSGFESPHRSNTNTDAVTWAARFFLCSPVAAQQTC